MTADVGLVGRRAEMARLNQSLERAAKGAGALVMLTGEAGIGKTRLATEFVARGLDAGWRVHWGRCREGEGAPAYWPWTHVLAGIDRERAAAGLPSRLAEMLAGAGTSGSMVSAAEGRLERLAAVADSVRDDARRARLVVVLDDLHWADVPSLRLLAHLVQAIDAPLLVVATWRADAVRARPEAESVLADVARAGDTIALEGLAPAETVAMVHERLGTTIEEAVGQAVHARTNGNPFLTLEVASLLGTATHLDAAALDRLAVSAGTREIVRQRLVPLPDETVELLRRAAVLGREFDVPPLAHMMRVTATDVVGRLAPAERAGLVRLVPEALQRYAFAHALVRESLYEALAPDARAALHRAAGDAIVALAGSAPERHLADLSYHYFEAARAGDATDAVTWSLRAGKAALDRLAFEDGIVLYERALRGLDVVGGDDPRRRVEALMGLAESVSGAGDDDRARAVAADAVVVARGLDDACFADAVARHAEVRREMGIFDEGIAAQLEEALARLPDEPTPLRARVMARLAGGLVLKPGTEARRQALADEAAEIAARVSSLPEQIRVLTYRLIAILGPDTLDDRLAIIDEIVALAERMGDRTAALAAIGFRVHDLLELGDRVGMDRTIGECDHLATLARSPLFAWQVASFRATVALIEARWSDAETLAAHALALGQRAQSRSALLHYGQQLIVLRGEAARLDEVIPLVEMAAAEASTIPAWQCTLAHLYAVVGRTDEARRSYDALAADGFASVPRDTSWLVAISSVTTACADLGDRASAGTLYEMLYPYRDLVAAARPAIVGLSPVATCLGRLATLLRRYDDADEHFERALAIAERMGGRAWAMRVRLHALEAVAARPGREREARVQAQEVADAARALEMHDVLRRLGEVRERYPDTFGRVAARAAVAVGSDLPTVVDPSPEVPRSEPTPVRTRPDTATRIRVFRREGDVWAIGGDGRLNRVRHAVGLAYMAHLLAHPRREVHVADLVGLVAPAPAEAPDRSDLGDAGPLLDAEAKSQYRARLTTIARMLDEAADPTDAEALRREQAFLRGELARGVGLGRYDRRGASAAERARVAVTKAIRYAIGKVATYDAFLAAHLDVAVRTGTYCAYVPPADESVVWSL